MKNLNLENWYILKIQRRSHKIIPTIANISTERELTNETLTSLNDTISTKSAEI